MNNRTIKEEAANLRRLLSGIKNKAQFAKDYGIPGGASMLSQHQSGHRPISLEAAKAYAKGLGIGIGEIAPRFAKLVLDVSELAQPAPHPKTYEIDISTYGAVPMYHAPDAVLVPILANCASMGPGAELLDSDVIVGDLALSPHWINQYIRPQNPRELRFIHAYGDSMAPTFSDGDVLLVDTGPAARDPYSREGVYVLQADGKNYVKRVTPTFDGKLQVTSDNPSSKTVQVLNGDHQVDVVGRVVWAWNGKRL
ncbi:MAG: helix-turn-helix transcriptional regulator [Comamonas sp.]|jgi:phage repressor protein C with HTH and peptisase S24 domain|nr:helix-turn-helix transcriptional regulator [Comamonas sp.]